MAGLSIPDVRGILAWWNRHMMVNRYKYASKQRSTRVGRSLPKMRRTHDYESAVRRYPKNKIRICEKNSNFLADSYFAVPSTPVSHSVSLGVFTCVAKGFPVCPNSFSINSPAKSRHDEGCQKVRCTIKDKENTYYPAGAASRLGAFYQQEPDEWAVS